MVDKKKNGGREKVNLSGEVVDKVRKNKKKTGVPISTFIEKATLKELAHQEFGDDKIHGNKK